MNNKGFQLKTEVFLFIAVLLFVNTSNCAAPDSLKVLGHASVKIKTSEGKIIYIDPFAGTDYADSADIVLVTHQHSDHNRINLVTQKKSCTVITNFESNVNGEYKSFTVGDIKIDAVPAYNSNHQKNACVGYVLEFSGIKLYHAGDTGKITEMADLSARQLTYALLPMDGIYNMSPEDAAEAASLINAKYYIPIHTTGSTGTFSDAIVARFNVPNKIIVKPGTTIELNNAATAINGTIDIPNEFKLNQNYPNPFNPTTKISYQLPVRSNLKLSVYNLLGEEVVEIKNANEFAGYHEVEWDALNLSSGVYFYKISANAVEVLESYTKVKKMLLLK